MNYQEWAKRYLCKWKTLPHDALGKPYYPVNDKINNEIYQEYKKLSKEYSNIYFGGRLAEYKYYDMHKVIESALAFVSSHKNY